MKKEKVAKVYWHDKDNHDIKGNGSRLTVEEAKAEVKVGNKEFPHLHHWYEIMLK